MPALNTRVTDLEPSDLGTGQKQDDSLYDIYGNTRIEVATESGSKQMTMDQLRTLLLGDIYPVGSIYQTTDSKNPRTTLGFGTWRLYGDSYIHGQKGAAAAIFGAGDQSIGTTASEEVRGNVPDDLWVNGKHWGWYHLKTENFPSSGHVHPAVDEKNKSTVSSKWVYVDDKGKQTDAKDMRIAIRPGYGMLSSNQIVKNKILAKRNLGETNQNITCSEKGDPYKVTIKVKTYNEKTKKYEYVTTKNSTDIKADDMKFVKYNNDTYVFTTVPEMKTDDPKKGFSNKSKWLKVVARTKADLKNKLGTIVKPTSENWNKKDKTSNYYNPITSPCTWDEKLKVKENANLIKLSENNVGDYVEYVDPENGAVTTYVFCTDEEVRTKEGVKVTNITNITNNYIYKGDGSIPSGLKVYRIFTGNPLRNYFKPGFYDTEEISVLSAGVTPQQALHIVNAFPQYGISKHIYVRTSDRGMFVYNGKSIDKSKDVGNYKYVCTVSSTIPLNADSLISIVKKVPQRIPASASGTLYCYQKKEVKDDDTKKKTEGGTNTVTDFVQKAIQYIPGVGKVPPEGIKADGVVQSLMNKTESFDMEKADIDPVTGDIESVPQKTSTETKDTYRVKIRKWVPYVSAVQNVYQGRTSTEVRKDSVSTAKKVTLVSTGGYYGTKTNDKSINSIEGDIVSHSWLTSSNEWIAREYMFKPVEDRKEEKIENADGTVTYKYTTKVKSKWVMENTGYTIMDEAEGTKDDDTRRDTVLANPFNDSLSKKVSQIKFDRNSSSKKFDTGLVLCPAHDDPDFLTHYRLLYSMLFWPGVSFSWTEQQQTYIRDLLNYIYLGNTPTKQDLDVLRDAVSMTDYVDDKTAGRKTELWPTYPDDADKRKEWKLHDTDFHNTGWTQSKSHIDGTIVNLLPEYVVVYRWVRVA